MGNTMNKGKTHIFRRGQIYIASLGRDTVGSEQGGKRPVLVVQNDIGNKYSTTMVVAPLSSKIPKKVQSTHVLLNKEDYEGLDKDCVVMTEQLKTISKDRIEVHAPITTLDREGMNKVNSALLMSLGISI